MAANGVSPGATFSDSLFLFCMPTYEYVCEKCGHEFEKFQLMAAKPLTVCPEDVCPQKTWKRGKVKKIISAGAGLIFKGSGFYITDYRSEKYKEAAKKESSSASGESKPAASSGNESKSASKPEDKPTTPSKPAAPKKSSAGD